MIKRKDGLWQEKVTLTVNGQKKLKYFYGSTKAEIYRKINAYKEEMEKGVLFAKAADDWWEEHQQTLSPTVVPSYLRYYKYCKTWFGETPIKNIKPLDIRRFMDKIIAEHNMARKTASNLLIVVRLIFKYAVREGYIDISPANEISISNKLPKSERLLPDNNDIEKIKASVNCTFGLFAYFILYTGLRKGEALALRWSDIDMSNRTVKVSKSIYQDNGVPMPKEPKTKAGFRTVPIVDMLYKVLKPGKDDCCVFTYKDGMPLSQDRYCSEYEKYRKESGVTCTAHQIRHLYATMLYENDIDVKDAQHLLGHAQYSTTQDIYTHVRSERELEIKGRMLSIDIK